MIAFGTLRAGDTLIELGAGTGRNLDFVRDVVPLLARVELVDLCPALLELARMRTRDLPNVHVVEADVSSYRPDSLATTVVLSYALTMAADWETTLRNAIAMLRPGGTLAVVDFSLSDVQPDWQSAFWRRWFAHDGVALSADHLPALRTLMPAHTARECLAPVPYLPGLRVPFYLFLGSKAAD